MNKRLLCLALVGACLGAAPASALAQYRARDLQVYQMQIAAYRQQLLLQQMACQQHLHHQRMMAARSANATAQRVLPKATAPAGRTGVANSPVRRAGPEAQPKPAVAQARPAVAPAGKVQARPPAVTPPVVVTKPPVTVPSTVPPNTMTTPVAHPATGSGGGGNPIITYRTIWFFW